MNESETRTRPIQAANVKDANVSGMATHEQLVAEAQADQQGYSSRFAREFLIWEMPFAKSSITAEHRSLSGSKTAR